MRGSLCAFFFPAATVVLMEIKIVRFTTKAEVLCQVLLEQQKVTPY